jgi:MarR family transcriptional regulator, organic hydroperoxide resistance regulator
MSAADVRLVQTCYPKIYLACHTRHQRAASSDTGLSPRDSSLLTHLDERRSTTPTELARHLGVSKSTMSAAVKRLRALAYVVVSTDPRDGRTVLLRLAPKGAAAMRASSVLEPGRVRRLLGTLSNGDRRTALHGLELLAEAAQRMMRKESAHA